jgi:hypothetical protein
MVAVTVTGREATIAVPEVGAALVVRELDAQMVAPDVRVDATEGDRMLTAWQSDVAVR